MRTQQRQFSVEEHRAWDRLRQALRVSGPAFEQVREVVEECPGCLDMVDTGAYTALHLACFNVTDDTLRIVKYLLRWRPMLIHLKTDLRELPLHLAARHHDWNVDALSVIQFLAVASPQAALLRKATGSEKTVLYEAVESRASLEVVAYLTAKGPYALRVKADDGTVPLHAATVNGLPLSVVRCLTHEWMGGLQERDFYGRVPTHLAALNGADADVLQFLTDECPGSVMMMDQDLELPLHCAAICDESSGNIQWLIDRYPAGVRARNRNGMLPLHFAAKGKQVDAVQVLLNADPETAKEATIDGRLALHMAAKRSPVGVVRVLYDAYPDGTQVAAKDGSMPLHLAAECGTLCTVQLLVDRDPKALQHRRKDGFLPLQLSALRSAWPGSSLDVIYLLARRWPEAIGGVVGDSFSPPDHDKSRKGPTE